jgi:Ca-activated chloride channel family protein
MKKLILTAILAISVFAGYAQSFTLRGTVVDANDEPVMSAQVQLKGTDIVTITDFDGMFEITTPDVKTANIILITPIGAETEEYKINPKENNVRIKLKRQEVAELEELVVVGYGVPAREKRWAIGANAVRSVYVGDMNDTYSNYDKHLLNGGVMVERNSEEYGSFVENRFQSAQENPLSTFSLDVDAAAYSNIRRVINNGQMPDKEAVRIEN